jgi:hypothetical protein
MVGKIEENLLFAILKTTAKTPKFLITDIFMRDHGAPLGGKFQKLKNLYANDSRNRFPLIKFRNVNTHTGKNLHTSPSP